MNKKLSIIFTLIAGLFPLLVLGERVNRNTEVYREPGKEAIGQLYKGSGIYVASEENGWAKIISVVTVPKAGFNEYTLQLPKKTILYDMLGQETGKMYGMQKLPAGYEYDDRNVIFELVGYIYVSEIDTNWLPEKSLARLIDSTASQVPFVVLKAEMEKFQFYVTKQDSGFIAYQLNDVVGLNFKNPIERLRLVFYEERLVAIFHKKPFKLKRREVIQVDGRENLIYLRDLSPSEKKTFGRLFLQ